MSAKGIVDLVKAASYIRPITWYIHECSICDCPVGYIFKDGQAYYDSSCDCVSFPSEPTLRSWDDVERTIELNIDTDIVKNLMNMLRSDNLD